MRRPRHRRPAGPGRRHRRRTPGRGGRTPPRPEGTRPRTTPAGVGRSRSAARPGAGPRRTHPWPRRRRSPRAGPGTGGSCARREYPPRAPRRQTNRGPEGSVRMTSRRLPQASTSVTSPVNIVIPATSNFSAIAWASAAVSAICGRLQGRLHRVDVVEPQLGHEVRRLPAAEGPRVAGGEPAQPGERRGQRHVHVAVVGVEAGGVGRGGVLDRDPVHPDQPCGQVLATRVSTSYVATDSPSSLATTASQRTSP